MARKELEHKYLSQFLTLHVHDRHRIESLSDKTKSRVNKLDRITKVVGSKTGFLLLLLRIRSVHLGMVRGNSFEDA